MEELLNGEIKTENKSIESSETLSQYTSEQYLDDILELFYADGRYKKIDFNRFQEIDKKSLQSESDIFFIKQIEKHNFNIIERFILIYIAILQLTKSHRKTKNEIIENLIEMKITKPSNIVKLLSRNSKLFETRCLKNKPCFSGYEIEIDNLLFALLLTDTPEETEENNTQQTQNIIKPNEIYKKLNDYIIGQESAIKNISAAVYEHIIKCKINQTTDKDKLDKTNTLIIGPTGTGKTFICNTLSKILDIPIYIADASQMTESGYVGLSPETIFLALERRCKQKMKDNKFPVSIIYIDEIDKIAINNNKINSVGEKSVQEEFLKIFESNKYFCDGGRFSSSREYDISNIMFILGGAFSGLEKIIENRLNINKQKGIGFIKEDFKLQNNSNILQQATTEDLIKYGFMPEFIGRLPNKVILNALTKQDLITILSESQNNVIEQYKQVFMEAGIKLEILEETIEYVAEQAIKNNTGARGLKSILSGILNKILFEVASSEQTDFTLSPKEFSSLSNNL